MLNMNVTPDACITCATCVVHCPVAAVTSEFLGPRMVGPGQERFRLLDSSEESSLHYCANCKNCDMACPHNVPISTLNMLARGSASLRNPPSITRVSFWRDYMLAHGADIGRWLGFIPASLRNFGMLNPLSRVILHALGIHKQAPLPPFAPKTFTRIFRELKQDKGRGKVVFFPGCYVEMYDPYSGLDVVRTLQRAGYEVELPEHISCCGLPMVSNGFWEHGRGAAYQNAKALYEYKRRGIPVLTACPSCALMFNAEIPLYFPDIADAFGRPEHGGIELLDVQEFLLDCMRLGKLSVPQNMNERKIMYHAPCHLRAQGTGLPAFELLRKVYGERVQYAASGCCGISGSYGFKKEKYAIAQSVGSELFAHIGASEATCTSSECGTCRVQIGHGTGLPCRHPVSLLVH